MQSDTVDSYHSWMLVAFSFILYFLYLGSLQLSGLLYVEIMLHFSNVSRQEASLPFVLALITRSIAGPIAGFLGPKLGFRKVIVSGSVITSTAVCACFFTANILSFTILWGGVVGLGVGLTIALLPQVINVHFKKHFLKANGLAMAGSPLSIFVLIPVVRLLLGTFGLFGTFLMLSGLVLQGVPAALMIKNSRVSNSENTNLDDLSMKKIPQKKRKVDNFVKKVDSAVVKVDDSERKSGEPKNLNILSNCDISSKEIGAFQNINSLDKLTWDNGKTENYLQFKEKAEDEIAVDHDKINFSSIKLNAERFSGEETSQTKQECDTFITSTLHLKTNTAGVIMPKNINKNDDNFKSCEKQSRNQVNQRSNTGIRILMKNRSTGLKNGCFKPFLIFCNISFLIISFTLACQIIFISLNNLVIIDYGLDKGISIKESSFLLIGLKSLDLFSSLFVGFITDMGFVNRNTFCAIFSFLSAISAVFTALSTGFGTMMAAIILQGLCLGSLRCTIPGLVPIYIEKDLQTMAMASATLFIVPISLLTPLLIGYFRDDLGCYDPLMYICSLVATSNGILVLLLPCLEKRRLDEAAKKECE